MVLLSDQVLGRDFDILEYDIGRRRSEDTHAIDPPRFDTRSILVDEEEGDAYDRAKKIRRRVKRRGKGRNNLSIRKEQKKRRLKQAKGRGGVKEGYHLQCERRW